MLRFRALATSLLVASAVVMPATLAAQAPAASAPAARTDVTGKWTFTVTTPNGTGTPTVTFSQKGDSITGRYSSPLLGERDLKGTVKDGKIDFTFTAEVQGTSIVATYTGTIEGPDAMKGTIDFGGQMSATFTGKKQP